MRGWFDLKPLFLGRLKPERLTSNKNGGTSSPSISPRPQWAGAHICIHTRPSVVYISQLIRFVRVSSHVLDFNMRNRSFTAKLLKQGYRNHKLRKAFSQILSTPFRISV